MVHSCSGRFFAVAGVVMCLSVPNVVTSDASGELCLLQSAQKPEVYKPGKRDVAHHTRAHTHAHAHAPVHAHEGLAHAHRLTDPEDSARQSLTAVQDAQNERHRKMNGEDKTATADEDGEGGFSFLSIIHPLTTLILLILVVRREFQGKTIMKFGEGNERFSPAAGFDDIVFVSGKVGDTDLDSIEKQAETALANVDSVLTTSGTSKAKLLYAQIYLRRASDADAFNKVWASWLAGNKPPARVCFEAQLLRPTALLEISVVAAR